MYSKLGKTCTTIWIFMFSVFWTTKSTSSIFKTLSLYNQTNCKVRNNRDDGRLVPEHTRRSQRNLNGQGQCSSERTRIQRWAGLLENSTELNYRVRNNNHWHEKLGFMEVVATQYIWTSYAQKTQRQQNKPATDSVIGEKYSTYSCIIFSYITQQFRWYMNIYTHKKTFLQSSCIVAI